MKRNLILWSLIALLAALGAACNDGDDNTSDDSSEKGDLKPVVLPTNPRIEELSDVTVVLTWDGNSSGYEVEMNKEVLPATQSISYGLKGLTPETTYTWKVRSKEGQRYSEWVNGPDFTTTAIIDNTKNWQGNWKGTDFQLNLFVLGSSLPVTTFLPQEVLGKIVEVDITKKDGSSDRIFFSSPRLQEIMPTLPLQLEAQIKANHISILDNVSDTLIADLDYPLSIDNLPEEVSKVVRDMIEQIPLIGEIFEDIKINQLGIVMEGLNLSGQLKDNNELPVNFSVNGKFLVETDNALVNTALNLLPLNVSLDAKMTLNRNQ